MKKEILNEQLNQCHAELDCSLRSSFGHAELDSASSKRPSSTSPVGSGSHYEIPDQVRNDGIGSESGRSMVEMLGVLAVVGLLSVMAFAAFRIALNKAKANTIVHDGRMVWMEALANQQPIPDWTASTMANESDKQFYAKRDIKENNYVKVEGVEEEVCQQILGLQKDGELIVLTESQRPFTECQESSDLIFGFDGVGRLIPCETNADCQEEGKEKYNGYCDTEEGYCHECGALELLNEGGTACVCDTTKAVSCSDGEGNSWCCGDDTGASNLICGGSTGSCVPNPDGKCWYEFAQSTTDKPLCHYTLSQTTTPKPLCHYTVSVDSDTNEASLSEVGGAGCPTGQYCYLKFSNTGCSGAGDSTTDLYGLCQPMYTDIFDFTCSTNEITAFEEKTGCPSDQYCYLTFRNTSCQGADNSTTDLYGLCFPMYVDIFDFTCSTNEITAFDEIQGCPANQYCYINWRNNSCSTAGNGQTGTLYGACVPMDSASATCPY